MSAAKNYKTLCVDLAKRLAPFGFRRVGGSFIRTYPEVTQVIGIQKSTSSTAESFRFRLNEGLWSPMVAKRIRRLSTPPRAILACQSYTVVSDPRRSGVDLWWAVDSPESLREAVEEIAELLIADAIPRLDRLSTTIDLKEHWQNSMPDWHEIISAELDGRTPEL